MALGESRVSVFDCAVLAEPAMAVPRHLQMAADRLGGEAADHRRAALNRLVPVN